MSGCIDMIDPKVSSAVHAYVPPTAWFRNLDDFNAQFGDTNMLFLTKYGELCDVATSGAWLIINHAGLPKLANIIHAKELQKRFDALGVPILALSIEPGSVRTGA